MITYTSAGVQIITDKTHFIEVHIVSVQVWAGVGPNQSSLVERVVHGDCKLTTEQKMEVKMGRWGHICSQDPFQPCYYYISTDLIEEEIGQGCREGQRVRGELSVSQRSTLRFKYCPCSHSPLQAGMPQKNFTWLDFRLLTHLHSGVTSS